MIALTTIDNRLRWFNPRMIAAVYEAKNVWGPGTHNGILPSCSYVWVGGSELHVVRESVEEVLRLIESDL